MSETRCLLAAVLAVACLGAPLDAGATASLREAVHGYRLAQDVEIVSQLARLNLWDGVESYAAMLGGLSW
jgi:hypothetical protein